MRPSTRTWRSWRLRSPPEQESCGSDYVKLQELQARQAELEAALEEKTERWVYLNELKEQIDAQNG